MFALALLAAYLLGTIIGGWWVGRLRGGVDLRRVGSGNVGATNALRTQGRAFAAAVLAIDASKGVLAAWLVPRLFAPAVSPELQPWLPYACGLAATLGHVFPVWFGFSGGKGAATFAGVFAVLLPATFLWMLAAFVTAVMVSGIAALGTLSAAAVAVVHVLLTGAEPAARVFVIAAALLVLFTHRANIGRMLRGQEPRFPSIRDRIRWRGR